MLQLGHAFHVSRRVQLAFERRVLASDMKECERNADNSESALICMPMRRIGARGKDDVESDRMNLMAARPSVASSATASSAEPVRAAPPS